MQKCDFCEHDKGPRAKDRSHCEKCHNHDQFQRKLRMTPRQYYEWQLFTGIIPRDPRWTPSQESYHIVKLKDAIRKAFATSLETAGDYRRTAQHAKEYGDLASALEFAAQATGITEALEDLYGFLKEAGCEDILADFVSSGDS